MKRRRPQLGFTVIELLCVIVLMSLASAAVMVGLSSSSDAARLGAAAASLRDLDARARQLARVEGPVEIVLEEGGTGLRVQRRDAPEVLARVAAPLGTVVRLDTPGPAGVIRIDRLGCSVDYDVELAGPRRTVAWSVHGLTGLVQEAGS